MRYLLDTNVVLWLLLGDRAAVPTEVVRAIQQRDAKVFVSAASVWEIAIKRSVGKLRIDARWREALMDLEFEHLPINAQHAARVENLPWHHRDPFDRLLVAQALLEDSLLVTADRTLDAYVDTLWA